MRPLNSTHVHSTPSLDAIAADLEAGVVMMVALMPGGDLRLVRANSGSNPALVRAYATVGQFVDAPTWAAILAREPVDADAFLAKRPAALRAAYTDKWLATTAQSHAIVAPLAGPLLRGFPGAIVALGGKPFADDALRRLAEAARAMEADSAYSAPLRLGNYGDAGQAWFAIGADGKFVGQSPSDVGEAAGIDETLAQNLEEYARRRAADATPATGGERVLLADATGHMHAFTIAYFESHAGLAPDGGAVLIVCRAPHFAEWLELKPVDFVADGEIGRLLPAFKFMKEHFPQGVTLPKIAGHVHLSPFHFHRRFTELLGITPKHFLYDCQIAKAQEMLLASTHELEEIAKLCGFAHQSHFTSRFKQATGLTPTRWRRQKYTAGRANLTPSRI